MQIKLFCPRVSFVALMLTSFAFASSALAATLSSSTAAHLKPEESSPVVTVLNAGTAPVIATDAAATAPAGWIAVELHGPFQAYVQNKDIQKSLDVRKGAALHLAPKADSPVLTTMEGADKTEITGLMGKWTQVRLEKRIIAYVHTSPAPTVAPTPTPVAPKPSTAAPVAPAPVPATAYGVGAAGQAASQVSLSEAGGPSMPRLLAGKFVSTRSPFKPRRPYDWALNDDAGKRYAYLDISKLLLTEQIESYIDHSVVVFGAAKPIAGTKDFVIEVESLQLR